MAKIYPDRLPLRSPRAKLSQQRESKTEEELCIGILAISRNAKFPLKNYPPGSFFPQKFLPVENPPA